MTIRIKYILIGVGILLLSAAATAARAQDYTADDYYRQAIDYLNQKNEEKAREVFNKGVELDMKLATVDDILKSSYVKCMRLVKYDAATGKDNFDELVYKSGKPTVVFFDDSKPSEESSEFSKREAIVFKALSEIHGSKLYFVVYNDRIAPKKQGWTASEWSVNENIKDFPSIALYSKYDLEKGETLTRNDGKLKQVDIMQGGPSEDKWIFPTFENTYLWWINQHCLYKPNPDGDGKVYKYGNTFKLEEVKGVFVK
ncbi:MAG: tetratricopeptide repeat protein [Deltaproteobacteria bacterium]|nr:tetratricopeptide repeat protein [Candidatus Zymogenaceae bacterium]